MRLAFYVFVVNVLLPLGFSFEIPSSFLISSSCVLLNMGPSLQTLYLPMVQLPHRPMPHRIRRSRLACRGCLCFCVVSKIFLTMISGPQVYMASNFSWLKSSVNGSVTTPLWPWVPSFVVVINFPSWQILNRCSVNKSSFWVLAPTINVSFLGLIVASPVFAKNSRGAVPVPPPINKMFACI